MGKRGSFTIANPRSAVSFDHLVGQREQLIRLVEPKRLVAALERVRGHALRVLRPPGNIGEHQPIVDNEKDHSKAEIPDREWIE
jgi:hypothetical protein